MFASKDSQASGYSPSEFPQSAAQFTVLRSSGFFFYDGAAEKRPFEAARGLQSRKATSTAQHGIILISQSSKRLSSLFFFARTDIIKIQ